LKRKIGYRKIRIKVHPRIIAGKIKGKLIECPQGEIRPMTAKVKEALFDIIKSYNISTMLDLFTGSGNISIEAFSRGIESADLVEVDLSKKKIIQKNLDNAGFANAKLIISDAINYCKRCTKKYDFIMADPPFKWERKVELLKIISDNELLSKDGFLVIHLQKKEIIEDTINNLMCYDTRVYGLNMIKFYKVKS
jgi:16S rRNA (guanine(966)-N(2))-methyltransferase RsmD